jgi:nucleotide-binding universal stress UspA family protein
MTDHTNSLSPSSEHPILVFGDDASESAGVAWNWICAQAWPGWELVCLHAKPPEVPRISEDPAVETPRPWEPEEGYRRIPPRSCRFESTSYMVSRADPRIALILFPNPSLIVIGAGRIERRLSALLGSTAYYLLADPPAPLALIKKASPVRRVLAAVDGSPSSLAAIAAFAELPWAQSTDVELVTVAERQSDTSKAVLDGAVEKLSVRIAGDRISQVVLLGKPKKVLSDHIASQDSEPDLVVVGTRGHSTLPRPHIGSVTYALAHRDNINLLVARGDNPATPDR